MGTLLAGEVSCTEETVGWPCSPQPMSAAQGHYHHQKITAICSRLPKFSCTRSAPHQFWAPSRAVPQGSVPEAVPGLWMCQDPTHRMGDLAAARSLLLSHQPFCRRRSNAERKGSDLDASQKLKFSLVEESKSNTRHRVMLFTQEKWFGGEALKR